jgi:hypothetical protein
MHMLTVSIALLTLATTGVAAATPEGGPADEKAPVRRVGVYVLPYYQSAAPPAHPMVDVARAFDVQLASNDKQDILAVRDAIEAQPQLITPMTLMVLAIRLYDVGLRDDGVFWFYVARGRYVTLAEVINVNTTGLSQVQEAIGGFVTLAGPFFNSYAFCDLPRQRETSARAIDWIEKNPYAVIFMEQLPARPGDRAANLKNSIARLRASALEDQQYLADPKNMEEFRRKRDELHVPEQFCWVE